MSIELRYGIVRDANPRKVIHVVRVVTDTLDQAELDALADRMREHALKKGEPDAAVVVVQGYSQEDLRLFGEPYEKSKVRAAMFNAAINWRPIEFSGL